jgi:hypothetical protein
LDFTTTARGRIYEPMSDKPLVIRVSFAGIALAYRVDNVIISAKGYQEPFL